jgi:S-adenosylmethionine uptake transporter
MLILLTLFKLRHQPLATALRTDHFRSHVLRSLAGTTSLLMWFYAIAGLPLATAMTLNYANPLFVGAMVAGLAWRAGRRVSSAMLMALALGFAGVVVLLQPTIDRDQWLPGLIGALSAGVSALAYMSVKALSQLGEPETRIVFYFSMFNMLAGLFGSAIFGFHLLNAHELLLMALVGIFATSAQLAMTRAYGSGRTLLTANLAFSGIVFSSLFGVFIFDDPIHLYTLVGMGIIMLAGASATLLSARASRV